MSERTSKLENFVLCQAIFMSVSVVFSKNCIIFSLSLLSSLSARDQHKNKIISAEFVAFGHIF
jgi:hypothetical protein